MSSPTADTPDRVRSVGFTGKVQVIGHMHSTPKREAELGSHVLPRPIILVSGLASGRLLLDCYWDFSATEKPSLWNSVGRLDRGSVGFICLGNL